MPGWLTEELNGIALWQIPALIIAALILGYVLTRFGGRGGED